MRRPTGPAVLLLAATLAGGSDTHAQASTNGSPMEVTSDTRAYCLTLSERIERYRNVPTDVRDLQVEGRDLCKAGEVRGGISRLRRALMALRSVRQSGDGLLLHAPDRAVH